MMPREVTIRGDQVDVRDAGVGSDGYEPRTVNRYVPRVHPAASPVSAAPARLP